jgi:hypothetical protein
MRHVRKLRSTVAASLSLLSVAVAASLTLFSAPAFADPPLDMAHQFVAGDEIIVSGECPADGPATVVLYFDGDEISRQEKAEDTPAFTISGTIPDNVESGRYEIRVRCDGETAGDEDVCVCEGHPHLGLSADTPVQRGTKFHIEGSGCPPHARVTFLLDGVEIGSTKAREEGTFADDDTRMPEDVTPSPHVLAATCGSRELPPFGIEVVDG